MRRIFAAAIILVLLGPPILGFLVGIWTDLLWSVLVLIVFWALTFFWGKQSIVWVLIASAALALQPMYLWLRYRNGVAQIWWSQAAFEQDWPYLICIFIVNAVGLYYARKLWTSAATTAAGEFT